MESADISLDTLWLVSFKVGILHFFHFLIELDKILSEGRATRTVSHLFIMVFQLAMLYITLEEVRIAKNQEKRISELKLYEDTISEVVLNARFGIYGMGVSLIFAIFGLLSLVSAVIGLLVIFGLYEAMEQRLIMISITCQNIVDQLYESMLEVWEVRLGLISLPLTWLWGKIVIVHKVARISLHVLFLILFGHQSTLISFVSLVYGTWDNFLRQVGISEKIERKYEELKEMAKTWICERYFKIPDGLDQQHNHIYTTYTIGVGIIEFRIETRVLPDSRPEGVRCIRCFGVPVFYGEWFPLPSALAG